MARGVFWELPCPRTALLSTLGQPQISWPRPPSPAGGKIQRSGVCQPSGDRQMSLMVWTLGPSSTPEHLLSSLVPCVSCCEVGAQSHSSYIQDAPLPGLGFSRCVFLEGGFVALEAGFLSPPASTADTGHHRTQFVLEHPWDPFPLMLAF